MNFVRILVLTFLAGAASISLTRSLGWPYWSYFTLCVALGLLCYVISVILIDLFIERRAPEMASNEDFMPGTQAREMTAGIGVVPKWVSWIGLLSISFFVAIPFELVARLVR